MQRRRLRPCLIEPLEARIAPALLVNGANLLGGAGNPNTGDTSIGGNAVTLVKVLSGTALVWFHDGDVTGISFGPNTSLQIVGDVMGDIIGNLTAFGRLSDSDNNPLNGEDGAVLLPNILLGVKTSALSDQNGNIQAIISGGSISNLSINGRISGIYAGDGAFNVESRVATAGVVNSSIGFDVNPVDPGIQSGFAFTTTTSNLLPGASISGGTIQTGFELQIFAGSGGLGVVNALGGIAGGNIENLNIVSAFIDSSSAGTTPSYHLIAGKGGDGQSGGKGGSIVHILENSSNGTVKFTAGKGGTGTTKPGGAGGNVSGLDMLSDSTNYVVAAGDGGPGIGGGLGGSAINNNFANRTPTNSIILTANFTSSDVDDGGYDDVLIIDSSTGSLVVAKNVGGGASFPKVVQKINGLQSIVTVDALGTTPVDALVSDINSDGFPDVVVAYKNSNNLGFYINDGHGVFIDGNTGLVNGLMADLGFSPTLIAKDFLSATATSFAVLGVEGGKSVAHEVVKVSADQFETTQLVSQLGHLVTDLVTSSSGLFAGCQDGSLLHLTPNLDPNLQPYSFSASSQIISGGVSNLDVSSTGDQLLALSTAKKSLGVFAIANDGSLNTVSTVNLALQTGLPLIARFVDSGLLSDEIGVISTLTNGSRFDLYSPTVQGIDTTYGIVKSLSTQPVLKTFAVTQGASSPGFAFLGGSLSQFYFSQTLASLNTYSLPFSGKRLAISSGTGGDASDLGTTLGKAGAGGNISGLNADSNEINLVAGNGGNSANGPAGNGGSVTNPANFTSSSNALISPKISADQVLQIIVGDGGTPQGVGGTKMASGGNSGSISGLALSLGTGEVELITGAGGDAKGGKAGSGGSISGVSVLALDGSLTVQTGAGGKANGGANLGGNGGSVTNFHFSLELAPEVENLENSYFVSVTTGAGGDSTQGQAGMGGSLTNVSLKLDGADKSYDDSNHAPPLVDSHRDSTIAVTLSSGDGGSGAIGGAGGSVSGLTSESYFDQKNSDGSIEPNYVVMNLSTGKGGIGSSGNGGNGGNISFASAGLSGITYFDPDSLAANGAPLQITSGDGGKGAIKGGNGGTVSNLLARNTLFAGENPIAVTLLGGASVISGQGGEGTSSDGGKGGNILSVTIGALDGDVSLQTGDGGKGGPTGRGGDGGSITKSTLASVNQGLFVFGGDGGEGGKSGGLGGSLVTLQISTPQVGAGQSAILLAGDGGKATGASAPGGAGGNITSITDGKGINGVINLTQAGNGGDSVSGVAGRGGSVSMIKSVGFLGRPVFDGLGSSRLGVFDETGNVQGVFSGRAGSGTGGVNGSVSNVTARQIAAIAAAIDPNTNTFGVAASVANIKADLIGYDQDNDGAFDGPGAPNLTAPVDGFILTAALGKITTFSSRPNFVFVV